MKNNLLILLITFITFGLSVSCNKDKDKKDDNKEECITYKTAYVTSLDSPNTGTVNQKINIEVKFGVSNGCGGLGKFIETNNGNTRTIEVEAKYEGCVCTQDAPIRTVNYEFLPTNSGNYELKFKSSPTEFKIVNLKIK